MIKKGIYFLLWLLAVVSIWGTQGCTEPGDWQKATQLQNDTVYPERATGVQINITDSGHRIAVINSPLMERYAGKNPYLEMKEGVQAFFYDKKGVKENQLDANYAISYENEKVIEVRNNVRLENIRGEKLKTEKLTWNQITRKIYTDQPVIITTPTEVIYGDGLESNQNFTQYRIMHPHGTVQVKDLKTDSTNADTNN